MKAVIIEDEIIAAQNLQRLIAQFASEITIVALLQSVEESIDWFAENQAPDLVFMDIHLSDGSSFSIFDKVTIDCPIIFTTAYDEYALKAFEVNSIDYLLKPINSKQFERSIEKFTNLTHSKNENIDLIANFLDSFKETNKTYKSNFLIPHKDKLIPLAIDKIACFYTENKIIKIITKNNEIFYMDCTLDEIMGNLNPQLFFRANRQYIVSHVAIKDISIWFGSKLSINLCVQVPEKIIVSKARAHEFKTWYTK